MVDHHLRHLPVVGRLAVWSSALLEIMLSGGDVVFTMVAFLFENVIGVLGILRLVGKLADRLDWLPASVFNELVTAALVAVLFIEVARLTTRATS
jgi:hypothetical protein